MLTGVDHSMRCMQEETFGPTLPIMRVKDDAEAVSLANDSRYGLAACVFTTDRARGERIAAQLDAGTVTINDAIVGYFALEIPMGGHKESGIGSRHSSGGIQKYCTTKVVVSRRFSLAREPLLVPLQRHGRPRVQPRAAALLLTGTEGLTAPDLGMTERGGGDQGPPAAPSSGAQRAALDGQQAEEQQPAERA